MAILKKIGLEGDENMKMNFLQANIDTDEIISKGTSGDIALDLAFNFASKVEKKITGLKRMNEVSDIQNKSDKNIQDLELKWANIDKFSDDNYNKYQKEYESVIERNRQLISDTKYTNAEDVTSWDINIDKQKQNGLYTLKGHKNNYDMKVESDKNITDIETKKSKFVMTGDDSLIPTILKKYDVMEAYGVPKSDIASMKMKTLAKIQSDRTKFELTQIVGDPNKSIKEKRESLEIIRNTMTNEDLWEGDANDLIKQGLLDKEDKETYITNCKSQMNETLNGTGNTIQQLNNQIKNEEYNNQRKIDLEIETNQKEYDKTIANTYSNISSGNTIEAINEMNGTEIEPSELISDSVQMTEYFGGTTPQLLKDGKYVKIIGKGDLDRIGAINNIAENKDNLTKGSVVVNNILSTFVQDTGDVRDMKLAQLVESGSLNKFDVTLHERKYSGADELIDARSLGANKNFRSGNKLKFTSISGVLKGGRAIRENTKDLSFFQQSTLSDIMYGHTINGKYGESVNIDKGFTSEAFRMAYNNNESFREDFIKALKVVKTVNRDYKSLATLNVDEKIVNKKIGDRYDKTFKVRYQTREDSKNIYEAEMPLEVQKKKLDIRSNF